MKTQLTLLLLVGLLLVGCVDSKEAATAEEPVVSQSAEEEGWISLFDGETLDGWQASENPASFTIEDGRIVVHGPRAHLYYVGEVEDHTFKNFAFKADVMTMPGANSGLYFHTMYQEEGWPAKIPPRLPLKTVALLCMDRARICTTSVRWRITPSKTSRSKPT